MGFVELKIIIFQILHVFHSIKHRHDVYHKILLFSKYTTFHLIFKNHFNFY
jgi:hypothetical protein